MLVYVLGGIAVVVLIGVGILAYRAIREKNRPEP
jgi:hypothetical protein